jgi:hypothetical protein
LPTTRRPAKGPRRLANWGYDVAEAADGQEAPEKAAKFLPRVVADVLIRLDGWAC